MSFCLYENICKLLSSFCLDLQKKCLLDYYLQKYVKPEKHETPKHLILINIKIFHTHTKKIKIIPHDGICGQTEVLNISLSQAALLAT